MLLLLLGIETIVKSSLSMDKSLFDRPMELLIIIMNRRWQKEDRWLQLAKYFTTTCTIPSNRDLSAEQYYCWSIEPEGSATNIGYWGTKSETQLTIIVVAELSLSVIAQICDAL